MLDILFRSVDSEFDYSADLVQSVDDFQNFLGQIAIEYDADHVRTIWTLYDFPIHRISDRIGRFGPNRWRFWKFIWPDEHWMRCWHRTKSFEHCTIPESADSTVELVPNRRSERSVDDFRNFTSFTEKVVDRPAGINLSTLYALVPLSKCALG